MSTRTRLTAAFSALAALVAVGALLTAGCGEPAPIVVGALVPDTGAAAPYGHSIRQGIDLAVETKNAAGGLKGRMFVVEYRDTKTSPEAAKAALQELIALKLPVVIGPGTSAVALELAPELETLGVALVSPSVSSPRLTDEGGRNFFRVYPSDVVEGPRMAEFCRKQFWSKVAIVADQGPFGQGLAAEFGDKFAQGVREIVYRADVGEEIDAAQLDEIVAGVRKAKPDAVYIAATISPAAKVVRALAQLEGGPALIGTSAVTRKLADEEFAGAAAEGVIFPQFFVPEHAMGEDQKAFIEAYRAKYQKVPDTFAAHAYDALMVTAEIYAATNVHNADNLAGELRRVEYSKGVTGRIKFDSSGNVIRAPRIFVLKGGEVVPFERAGS